MPTTFRALYRMCPPDLRPYQLDTESPVERLHAERKAELKVELDQLMRGLEADPSVALVYLPECESNTFHKLSRHYDGDLLRETKVTNAFRGGVDQVIVHGLREYAR